MVALLFALATLALWGCDSTPDADDPHGSANVAPTDVDEGEADAPDDAQATDAADTADDASDADEGVDDAPDIEPPRDVETDGPEDVEDIEPPDPSTCGYGEVRGRVCTGSFIDESEYRVLTLYGQDCNGVDHTFDLHLSFEDILASEGAYEFLNIPAGMYEMRTETPAFISDSGSLLVSPDQITELGIPMTCRVPQRAPELTVLSGAHEALEEIIEEIGFLQRTTLYQGDSADLTESEHGDGQALLAAANRSALQDELMNQGQVYINSGDWHRIVEDPERAEDVARMQDNLHRFVNSGKSLYIGDHALPLLELAFPEMLDLHGDDMSPQVFAGIPTVDLDVDVLSEEMQFMFRNNPTDALVEHTTVNLDSTPWTLIEDFSRANVTVHLSAPAVDVALDGEVTTLHDVPLLVSFQPTPTSGHVYFSVIPSDSNSEHMKSLFKWLYFQL